MNTQNVGSLGACKRLFDAGIVLETEAVWVEAPNKGDWCLVSSTAAFLKDASVARYPAVSMAEVWRELPEGIEVNGSWAPLFVNKISCGSSAGYRIEHHIIVHFSSENPTDALIGLLIWTRSQK